MAHACHAKAREAEAGGLEFEGHLLFNVFETSLACIKPSQKERKRLGPSQPVALCWLAVRVLGTECHERMSCEPKRLVQILSRNGDTHNAPYLYS